MIAERKNKLFLIIALFILGNESVNAQIANVEICVEIDTILNEVIRIKLPCGYKKQKVAYDEGEFIDFYYKDGSIITIFKGALQKTPLLSECSGHFVLTTDTVKTRIVNRGCKNDRRWREDRINGLRICYDNIVIDSVSIFDRVLDDFIRYILPLRDDTAKTSATDQGK